MISKEEITIIKNNIEELRDLIENQFDTKTILNILEKLGKLPKNIDYNILIYWKTKITK